MLEGGGVKLSCLGGGGGGGGELPLRPLLIVMVSPIA